MMRLWTAQRESRVRAKNDAMMLRAAAETARFGGCKMVLYRDELVAPEYAGVPVAVENELVVLQRQTNFVLDGYCALRTGDITEAEQMRQVFEQRRDLIVRRINAMPGVSCLKPSGAFYVMMNLEQILGKQIDGQIIGSGDDFAKLLLEKSLVAVVPGSGFGAPNFVRLSYAISTENIETGMDRLEGFLKQLQ